MPATAARWPLGILGTTLAVIASADARVQLERVIPRTKSAMKVDIPGPDNQLLHVVIGGKLKQIGSCEFADLTEVEFVGVYPNYAQAREAWRSKAQFTVDNALMRYFIIHAHRLLDPSQDDDRR